MSRRGNPYDHAPAERCMRTLKPEEVYGRQYRDLEDARAQIGRFLEEVYNRQRRQAALADLTPEEFERQHQPLPTPAAGPAEPVDLAGDGNSPYTKTSTTPTPDRCPSFRQLRCVSPEGCSSGTASLPCPN